MYQTLDHAPAASMYKKGMKLWKISDDGETWDDVLDQNITVTEVYGGDSAWFKFSKKLGIGNKATRYVEIISGEVGVEGDYSHGEGIDPWTSNEGEHAEGKYNKSNDGTISSVGIGTSDSDRKNAFEIMANGDAYLLGVGNYDGTNPGSSGVKTLQQSIEGGGTVLIHGEISYQGEDIFSFSPIEGELTLAEAVNLYKSGTSIILVFNGYESINPSDVIYSTVKYLAQSREADDARFKGDYWVDYYINRNVIWEGLI